MPATFAAMNAMCVKGIVLLLIGSFIIGLRTSAQCLVINEIMINAAGDCDGSCAPETAEWIEIYNTCPNPVNASCFVLTDGDFAVTFPSGTIIGANSYLVIGSPNSGVDVDLDISSCNCTSGPDAEVGILTNGNEQLALVAGSGTWQDAVYWGIGQFVQTPQFQTDMLSGCLSQTIALQANSNLFESIPSPNNGESVYRSCSDASIWISDGAVITPGTSNGGTSQGSITISASNNNPCEGSMVTLTAQSTATTGSIEWNTGSIGNSIDVTSGGIYTATFSAQGICDQEASFNLVYQPLPWVDAGIDSTYNCDSPLLIQAITNADSVYWEPSLGLSNADTLNPLASPLFTTNYTLYAITNDCIASDQITVFADCNSEIIPNIITPNDDGLNDTFQPEWALGYRRQLTVFNRWGVQVFETTDARNGWNAKLNGEPATEGVYYYILTAVDYSGNTIEQRNGHIQVVR
jgi:gliding motility-associated-like protein